MGAGFAEAVQRPPLPWLVAGLAAAVVGLVVAAVAVADRSLVLGSAGWVLAGPLAIGLLAGFVVADGRRRQRTWYVSGAAAAWLRRALVAAALIGVALAAWAIADVVARW